MKKKIAYFTSRFPTIAETFVLYEIITLRKLGVDIEVFSLIRQRESITHEEVSKLTPHIHYGDLFSWITIKDNFRLIKRSPLKYIKSIFKILIGNLKSPKFFKRSIVIILMVPTFIHIIEKSDIEHIHAHWATHPTLAAYMVKQFTGISYSFTAHANDIYVNQTMLAEKIKKANFIVTISDFNRHFLQNLFPELVKNKITIIRCGINPDIFHARKEEKLAKIFTIVCIARFDEKKGHKYLIDACTQLKNQGLNFQCLLIGDGKLYRSIKKQINQLELKNYVKLMDFQPSHIVVKLLQEAHLMVLPSIITKKGEMEGIPVSLMEALAMQVPVIATSISGIPELIKHEETGYLVEEKNSMRLAEAIMKIYHNKEIAEKMAVAGRKKVLKEFNLLKNTTKLLSKF